MGSSVGQRMRHWFRRQNGEEPAPFTLIQLSDAGQSGKVVRLSDEFSVAITNGLVAELRVLLGPDAILI